MFFNIVVECHWSKANAGSAANCEANVVAYCRKTFVRCLFLLLLLLLLFIRIRAKCDVEEGGGGVSELRLAERLAGLRGEGGVAGASVVLVEGACAAE